MTVKPIKQYFWYIFFFSPILLDNLILFSSWLRSIKSTLFIPDEVGVTFIVTGMGRVVSLKNLLVDDTIYC